MSRSDISRNPEMTPAQGGHLLSIAMREYEEGLDFLARERADGELERQLPGLHRIFGDLIAMLPDPNGIYKKPEEFPIAAAVAKKDTNGQLVVVAKSLNRVNELSNSKKHAEDLVLDEAQRVAGNKHLHGHYLISTCEGCLQCTGAAINTEVDGVIFGATHADLTGKHARIGDKFKPYRTSPDFFDSRRHLEAAGILVIGGFMRDEVLEAMRRSPSTTASYYSDPDA